LIFSTPEKEKSSISIKKKEKRKYIYPYLSGGEKRRWSILSEKEYEAQGRGRGGGMSLHVTGGKTKGKKDRGGKEGTPVFFGKGGEKKRGTQTPGNRGVRSTRSERRKGKGGKKTAVFPGGKVTKSY